MHQPVIILFAYRIQWSTGHNRIEFTTDWLDWANELATGARVFTVKPNANAVVPVLIKL